VLGVGLGRQTSNDLAYKVLSSVGLVGAGCFVLGVSGLFRAGARRAGAGVEGRATTRALRTALVLSLAMDWVAGWSYTYGDVWLVAGLILAAASIARSADGVAAADAAPVEADVAAPATLRPR
jgi:hypothetical protein